MIKFEQNLFDEEENIMFWNPQISHTYTVNIKIDI
jgi:hypothetical protein